MKFSLEESATPIYSRIVHCIAKSLKCLGHTAKVDDPREFGSLGSYLQHIECDQADVSLITNLSSLKTHFLENERKFVFEKIPHMLVFIHHDHYAACGENIWPGELIKAYQRVQERAFHFCIERSHCEDLIELGLPNIHFTHHATEFNTPPNKEDPANGACFVGHVLEANSDSQLTHHWLLRDYWSRVCDTTHRIQPNAVAYAGRMTSQNDFAEWLATKSSYLLNLHLHSLYMRGDVLKRTGSFPIHIYGGDPAYIHGMHLDRRMQGERFIYHPPTNKPHEAALAYNSSAISINITPLQFDTAVINRVLDIGGAGGFPLTDWKKDLSLVTSLSNEISYRSPEELQHKIDFYSHTDHLKERLEIIHCLHKEVRDKFSYENFAIYILGVIECHNSSIPSVIKVDLGCGSNKPSGFIGVDSIESPLVDKVADLTGRFPFASNSVDFVRAHDIIEHLPDRIHTMNEIWRICKNQALVDIRVPSTDGRGAFQDPTHVSYWNANSFFYYTSSHPAYFKLCQTYGFHGEYELISLREESSEDNVVHVHAQLKAIKCNNQDECVAQLLAELRALNIMISTTVFTEEGYQQLKSILIRILNTHSHPELTIFVDSEDISCDAMASILTQLMLELVMEGSYVGKKDYPNLVPAPKEPGLLKLLVSKLSYQGSLSEEDVEKMFTFLA